MRIFASKSNPRALADDNVVDGADNEGTPQGVTAGLGGSRRDNYSQTREMLDALSRSKIRSTAIKFTLGGRQANGGKADVVQARFRQWYSIKSKLVAVKKLQNVRSERARIQFAREVGLMAKMSHENIAKFIGFVEDLENGTAWIILSWEPNGNIREFLAKGNLEIPERVSLIRDTFVGVYYLHNLQPPICHGDLKSLNILVSSSCCAIITDFGSAREISAPEDKAISDERGRLPTAGEACTPVHVTAAGAQLTLTGPAWSLRWASPEVVNGKRPSLSSDIWAAGWVCWEVMTNTFPFHELNSPGNITLAVINGEVPSPREDEQLAEIVALCSLMTDCWAFSPKDRPSVFHCLSRLETMPATRPSGGSHAGSKEHPINLLIQKGWMYYQQNNYKKSASVLEKALSLAESQGNRQVLANVLIGLGRTYRDQYKLVEAEDCYTRAKEICARIGDDSGRGGALTGLGSIYRLQSNFTKAEELYTQAQDAYIRYGDGDGGAGALPGLGLALRGLGEVYRFQGRYTQAEKPLIKAEEIFTLINDEDNLAAVSGELGFVYSGQSKYTKAEQSFTQAQELCARTGNRHAQAVVLCGLGDASLRQSKYPEAGKWYTQAREIFVSIDDALGQAYTSRRFGQLCRDQGRNTEAASHLSKSRDLYAKMGMPEDVAAISDALDNLSANTLPTNISL